MLYVHRWASLLAGVLILYIAGTGMWVQSMDLFAQVTHQPVTDPSLQEFRQHLAGPDNYAVLSDQDYTAATLPAGLDTDAALRTLAQTARKATPDQPMRLIELRMVGDQLAGRVKMGSQFLLFDPFDGARLPDRLLPPANPNAITHGLRSQMKNFHKFTFNNFMLQKASIFNLLGGIGIVVLAVTGLTQYIRMLGARRKIGRPQLFWSTKDIWRQLHRWLALILGAVLLYQASTGVLLAISDLGAAYKEWKSPRASRPVNPDTGDYSTPLKDAEISMMATGALSAFRAAHPGVPIKVLQLRYFSGYSQGVVVTGEKQPKQHVYNTHTGREMSEAEPGYPASGNFPFGWQWHQNVKQLHRGDIFGLTGNWLEWTGGAGLIYFAISGLWMYLQLWRKRASNGRRDLVWK